jgi:hypothetical protein
MSSKCTACTRRRRRVQSSTPRGRFTAPAQIEMAVAQALARGIAAPEEFEQIIHATRANPYMRNVLRDTIARFVNRRQKSYPENERLQESDAEHYGRYKHDEEAEMAR